MGDDDSTAMILAVIKIFCMITFFTLILAVGSLPIKLKAFKTNKLLLAFTAAFSGGLFLSVGLVHLLPESVEKFEQHFEEQGTGDEEHFPLAYIISIASFALILFIEKIATDHHHGGGDDEHNHNNKKSYIHSQEQNQLLVDNKVDVQALLVNPSVDDSNKEPEEQFKEAVSTQLNIAKKISFVQFVKKSIAADPKKSIAFEHVNMMTPYILQIAVGIHAVFEGLSIGIQSDVSLCLGVAIAVLCHKWAEGLTLGLAFRQAGVDQKTSLIMIGIQAIMNPIGIAVGWALAQEGPIVTGIFLAISVGTFLYISTMEVIVEEFSIARYKWQKFIIFLIAIIFVSSFWYIEQATGSD